MLTLKEIQAPVAAHIGIFEEKFRASMKSSVPLLDKITRYIIKRKGKQMRPLFVFLAASVTGGIRESTYRAASLIELLHTATLVHDDVGDAGADVDDGLGGREARRVVGPGGAHEGERREVGGAHAQAGHLAGAHGAHDHVLARRD